MAELRVDIASEFTGKKAFDKAAKATSSLDKAVGKLGRQLVSVFAITKIVAFGKASVKAFLDDEAAATRLAKAVENLGLAFAQPYIDNFISKLESTSGILDDQLRPAFQGLLTTTGSLTKSQELLNLAIEGSRASTYDLATVAKDLGNAYVGNTKGLKKYNLGLDKATLSTISFADAEKRLKQQFSGANTAYLTTYAYKLDVLKVASENAKETIGTGLVDALVLAGGKDADIQNVADQMNNLATYTADTVRGLGVLVAKIGEFDKKASGGLLGKIISGGFNLGLVGALRRLGQESQPRPTAGRRFFGGAQANLYDSAAASEKKFRAEQKRLADATAKAAKALTAEQKKQAALKKAGSIFDLEQVQLIAALKGKLSDEDRKRVELQFAIITGNVSEAQRLTFELARAQGLSVAIAKDLASLPDAKNPFASWEAYLDMLMTKAQKVASVSAAVAVAAASNVSSAGSSIYVGGTKVDIPATNVATMPKPATTATSGGGQQATTYVGGTPIYVQIDGKTIASALQDSSLSGIGSSVNRTGR
jgi:hypothetical protein